LIENLCTDLGRETPGTKSFRINLDYKISEAEARASQSEAIPIGETPEQRKQEFQEALRKILHVGQDRDSSASPDSGKFPLDLVTLHHGVLRRDIFQQEPKRGGIFHCPSPNA
jgi:hypothetical protein